jgi:single-stranded-DNA-specific exonuclease
LLDRLMRARGLEAADDASGFLNPRLTQLHDPSLLPGMDAAARRVLDALAGGEKLVVYADYDADGVSAAAILVHMCRAIAPGAPVSTYVPHRLEEGYGINAQAVGELADAGARVIVSVDCGITALEPARVARERGVDLVITDHHEWTTDGRGVPAFPGAFSVVHPRLPGADGSPCGYPFGDLCGAGVAYKLAWRMATMHCGGERVGAELRRVLMDLLALASLGVIADVVPLLGENRVIAKFGLERIKHSPLTGLRALVEASGLSGESVDAFDVGFKLAPRLNAAGRMGHAADALELFTTTDGERAFELAERLTAQNIQRQAVERGILEEAMEMAERAGMTTPDRRAIVLADERWHAGVVGIVCSRLVERFHRPAILLQRRAGDAGTGDAVCHGSARSIDGFDLHSALGACSEHLDRFGGHAMAAGLLVRQSRLEAFVEAFTRVANDRIAPERLCSRIVVDAEAGMEELTPELVGRVESLAPFGRDNPSVKVVVRNVRVAAPARTMGSNGRHLALTIASGSGDSRRMLRTVAWNWGERRDAMRPGTRLDVVVEPKLSRYQGNVTVEPELKDAAVVG